MLAYIFKRLLLMVPTLFGVLLLTFAVIQFVPGGPVEQMVSQLQGRDTGGEGAAAAGSGAGRAWMRPALPKSKRSTVLTSHPPSVSG
jgi:microcin C transport system permease protein